MIGGGMSQSRWGINVDEIWAVVPRRWLFGKSFDAIGLVRPNGRFPERPMVNTQVYLPAGRQWNVLFDVVTSTYASFPIPRICRPKPELGMAMERPAIC